MAHKKKINMKNKVVVVAVHPDDETLGCGGTLLKHKSNGDEIHWVICTTISESDAHYKSRIIEINTVNNMYKFDSIHNLKLRTMQVDEYGMSEIVEKISRVINKIRPNIIYLPFKGDVHSDHRVIFEAAYSCTKSFRYSFIKKIYMMETLSETEFVPSMQENSFTPNTFVNISEFIGKKLEIIKVFDSEISKHPFPRSLRNLKALAIYRGATSSCDYAESFVLLKEIND